MNTVLFKNKPYKVPPFRHDIYKKFKLNKSYRIPVYIRDHGIVKKSDLVPQKEAENWFIDFQLLIHLDTKNIGKYHSMVSYPDVTLPIEADITEHGIVWRPLIHKKVDSASWDFVRIFYNTEDEKKDIINKILELYSV